MGFATYTEQTAHGTKVFAAWGLPLVPGYDQAFVKLTPDGALEVKAGIPAIGQGLETTLAQIAHEMTGVPFDTIRVTLGDTATTPFSTGAYASRGIVMSGGAVSRASGSSWPGASRRSPRIYCRCGLQTTFVDGRIFMPERPARAMARSCMLKYARLEQLPDDVDTGGLEVTEGYKLDVDTRAVLHATHAARALRWMWRPAVEIPGLRHRRGLRAGGEPDDRRGAGVRRRCFRVSAPRCSRNVRITRTHSRFTRR